jgi:hypothetical protein
LRSTRWTSVIMRADSDPRVQTCDASTCERGTLRALSQPGLISEAVTRDVGQRHFVGRIRVEDDAAGTGSFGHGRIVPSQRSLGEGSGIRSGDLGYKARQRFEVDSFWAGLAGWSI